MVQTAGYTGINRSNPITERETDQEKTAITITGTLDKKYPRQIIERYLIATDDPKIP